MRYTTGRRSFLQLCAVGGVSVQLFGGLERIVADETQNGVGSVDLVRFSPDLEPLVQLIENTSREHCISAVVKSLRAGTTYRELMTALYLAGIRNLSPSPGGALHAVFVIHSAHTLGMDLPPKECVLPMFWAIDNFKATQATNPATEKLTNLRRQPFSPEHSLEEFSNAMESYDAERAEAAMVGLLQSHGAIRIKDELWKQGATDYRAIGHKAIYVAQACRTLDTVGWQHAEPILRHVIRALTAYGTEGRVNGFNLDEQCLRTNLVHVNEVKSSLPSGWAIHEDQPQVVSEILSAMRTADHEAVCRTVAKHLQTGHATAGAIWDAVHLMAGEIVMRQTTIRSIHAVTSTNALHFAFNNCSRTDTRLFILLQAVGWMCHFIKYFESLNAPFQAKPIEALSPISVPQASDEAIDLIFTTLTANRETAARQALSFVQREQPTDFLHAARALVLAKGNESHRYKFPIAVFEDLELLSPRWRPFFLAATTCYLCSSGMPDSKVMETARELLS
ncbi:MAG: hypothetical protein KDA75_00300 [Planctomycetaceae bacterium]|nr:hypothetical protein [Planctomycetaceae bacterium]